MDKTISEQIKAVIEDTISRLREEGVEDIRKTVEYLEYGFKVVTCPICENETLDDFFICQHCGWEYDGCIKEDDCSSANKATVAEYRAKYEKISKLQGEIRMEKMKAEEENSALKENKGEKPQAWYEILISDYFIEYVKSDPDYEKDFKDANSVIYQFWDVIEGFTYGNIMRQNPTKAKDAAKGLELYGDWVVKGYWAFVNDEDNERDIGVISKSIREKDKNKTFYEQDPKSLSAVQLAFLIWYASWEHPICEQGCMIYEFTTSGDLKKYLLALKKRHEKTVESAK